MPTITPKSRWCYTNCRKDDAVNDECQCYVDKKPAVVDPMCTCTDLNDMNSPPLSLSDASSSNPPTEMVANLIEAAILQLVTYVLDGKMPILSVSNVLEAPKSCQAPKVIRFTHRNSVVRFGVTMNILSHIHHLIAHNQFCTKRDLYYQNPAVYGSQRYVDSVVDTISAMMQVPRHYLHVVATSKGLIAGDLVYLDSDQRLVDCSQTKSGMILPSMVHQITLLRSSAQFVLVVEKDATFQHLMEEKAVEKLGPCIIITAKGYPDLNTRQMLCLIADKFPSVRHFMLVDCDPHGIAIYLVYKYGSQVHSHDKLNLCVSGLSWLGILPSDLGALGVESCKLTCLTCKERMQIEDMIKREYFSERDTDIEELKKLLKISVKAEIQSLDCFGRSYLTDVYLPYKLNTFLNN